jgi:long-chain acyl-CoA synthetase
LLAIIVPEKEHVIKWAQSKGLSTENYDELLTNPELKKEMLKEMDAKAKEYNLNGLERIKKLHLTSEVFTQENDLITPTFKIKRNIAKKTFISQIDAMYAEPLPEPPAK